MYNNIIMFLKKQRNFFACTGVTRVLAAFVVGVFVSVGVHGFSLGAPDTTCGNITPGHGVSPQTTPAPYTVTPGAVRVIAGEKMLVTLEAAAGESFMGFLLQARTADTDQVAGTFFTTDHKYLNCDNGMNVSTVCTVHYIVPDCVF